MDEFDVAPQATWQIDPFGHSGFQASMMSSPLSGFNSVFFARADYQDQNYRKTKKSTEFYWQTSPSQGDTTATLGGILGQFTRLHFLKMLLLFSRNLCFGLSWNVCFRLPS